MLKNQIFIIEFRFTQITIHFVNQSKFVYERLIAHSAAQYKLDVSVTDVIYSLEPHRGFNRP